MDTSLALWKAIHYFGSISKMAKGLGIKRPLIYAWLDHFCDIALKYALQIEGLTHGEVEWETLVSPDEAYRAHCLPRLSPSNAPTPIFFCEHMQMPLHHIWAPKLSFLPNSTCQPPYNLERLIGLDENNHIVFGEAVFQYYQLHNKRQITAWRVSLAKLLAGKYKSSELVQTLLINERAALGIALKRYLGPRQGRRSDLTLRHHRDEVLGRTDQQLALLLGFASKASYRYAESVQLKGSDQLIQLVNEKKLSLSTAAFLALRSHEEQEKILAGSKKEIIVFTQQLKQTAIQKIVITPSKEI